MSNMNNTNNTNSRRHTDRVEMFRNADGKFPAFTSVGGYTVIYLTADNDIACAGCVNGKNGSEFANADEDYANDPQWQIVNADVYYEGATVQCCHCNDDIDSAYGDPDTNDDNDNA